MGEGGEVGAGAEPLLSRVGIGATRRGEGELEEERVPSGESQISQRDIDGWLRKVHVGHGISFVRFVVGGPSEFVVSETCAMPDSTVRLLFISNPPMPLIKILDILC